MEKCHPGSRIMMPLPRKKSGTKKAKAYNHRVNSARAIIENAFRKHKTFARMRNCVRRTKKNARRISGRVFARANVRGATWNSYLTYSEKWRSLTDAAREQVLARINVKRKPALEPRDGDGHWTIDESYASHSVCTQRRTFRPA